MTTCMQCKCSVKVGRDGHIVRRILLLLLLLIAASSQLRAQGCQPWTKQEVALEVSVEASILVDWGQTLNISTYPYFTEKTNLFLPKRPSRGEVNRYMIAYMLIHPLVVHLLSHKWRAGVQVITLAAEIQATSHNASIGIRLRF